MNLNQDGSDKMTTSASGKPGAESSNELTRRAFPYAMSLRFLDSKDGPIASKLAPFAQSYDEAILHALGAFQKRLPSGTSKTAIGLKYPCKALDGTVYWSDLEVAKESREMWMGLMTNAEAGRTPEVGVFVEDEQPAVPVVQVDEPLVGKDGLPVKITFYDYIVSTWICEDPKCPPPTYQGCLEYVARSIDSELSGMRLEIWDPVVDTYVRLNEKNYRGQMQSSRSTDPEVVYVYYY